ncbi:MAG TPA: ATPase, T2SS/T4P/T4SS family, partial [Pseudothauera hydrothermalis]|nr:ATPase, T2SS/T4P/T4SS family [Pseudothauera hydrothermalis]
MAANPQSALSGLARALIQHGRLTEADALSCATGSGNGSTNGFLIELAQRGLISTREIARFAAETFGYPLLDITALEKSYIPRDAIDRKLCSKHQVVALGKRQNRLVVAIADPSNMRVLDEIRFQTGLQVDLVVAEADKLARLVESLSESVEKNLRDLTGEDFDMDLLGQEGTDETAAEDASSEVDDAPVVRFIQKVLIDAINEGASDIHFEPYEKFYRIRVRTDGVLREIAQPPLVLKEKIAARIKVISRLDISEKRVPQDGRMKLALSKNKAIDFRVSTLPTLHGEKIVMRILDPSSAMLGVDALGYEPDQKQALLAAIERPYGMILV